VCARRNCPDRQIVELGRETMRQTSKPWLNPERSLGTLSMPPSHSLASSAFCKRPGDTPIN